MGTGVEVADVAIRVQPPLEPLLARVVEVVRAVARVLPLVVDEEEQDERETRGDDEACDLAGLVEIRVSKRFSLFQTGFRSAGHSRVLYDRHASVFFRRVLAFIRYFVLHTLPVSGGDVGADTMECAESPAPCVMAPIGALSPAPRPRRAAAGAALEKMRAIQVWEDVTESSALFRTMAACVDAELASEALSSEERMTLEGGAADNDDVVGPEPEDEDEFDVAVVEVEDDDCSGSESEGYESSFIDDEEMSGEDDSDEEWDVRKRVRFESEEEISSSEDEEGEDESSEPAGASEKVCMPVETGVLADETAHTGLCRGDPITIEDEMRSADALLAPGPFSELSVTEMQQQSDSFMDSMCADCA